MNPITTKLAMCCTLVVGAGLWGGMAQKFNAEDELSYEPNVACVKGSPYGKILALAMQGPISFYWHQGESHDDSKFLNASHQHDDSCSEGCGDQDVAQHDEGCGCEAHETPGDDLSADSEWPMHKLAKVRIKEMAAMAHRRTNGVPLTQAHQRYLQAVTEDKLKLAYELDPSNYTNFGNYHLFLTTSVLGKGELEEARGLELSKKTLEYCKKVQVDPAAWLTAASASYNIICHIGRYHSRYTIPEAKASLAEFDRCVHTFDRLLDGSVRGGRIVSEVRYSEMNQRITFLKKLRKAQGKYMKDVMSTKMANTRSHPHIVH